MTKSGIGGGGTSSEGESCGLGVTGTSSEWESTTRVAPGRGGGARVEVYGSVCGTDVVVLSTLRTAV